MFDGLRTRVLVCLSSFDVARAQGSMLKQQIAMAGHRGLGLRV